MPSSSHPPEGTTARDNAYARYRAFVRQNAAGIAEADATGRFRLVNEKFCEIVGYSEAELLNLRFHDITHPEDLATNVVAMDRLQREGVSFGLEKRYVPKMGRPCGSM